MQLIPIIRRAIAGAAAVAALAAAPLAAQSIETFDPDTAIDADLEERPGAQPDYSQEIPAQDTSAPAPQQTAPAQDNSITYSETPPDGAPVAPAWADPAASGETAVAAGETAGTTQVAGAQSETFKEDDLIGAAEGLFGKGAEGLARMIQDLLKEQGEPNAYIVGREAGGAFIVGARYGSGTLYHKVEGQRPVYWTGPSIGFDVGANAANTFVLVYNLYDTEQLYERYPAGEGQAYVVGGLTASYLRKDNVVLIPIRMGAGLRLGINAGYMKFSKEQRWMPF